MKTPQWCDLHKRLFEPKPANKETKHYVPT